MEEATWPWHSHRERRDRPSQAWRGVLDGGGQCGRTLDGSLAVGDDDCVRNGTGAETIRGPVNVVPESACPTDYRSQSASDRHGVAAECRTTRRPWQFLAPMDRHHAASSDPRTPRC